ncbi:uncharacterized protein LOC143244878 [Tachypleus tridentatus]|uniref:uncharacterized protein LOC143244878 n=1 Tax=Tachypleus tridentatus TaxID=6853 RepID=UPI003FD37124
MVYGSARPSALKMLDPIHHQGLRLSTGAFRISPVQSLYVESHEPSMHLRRLQLFLQYTSKLCSLTKHPTWGCVFLPRWAVLFQNRRCVIAPFGLRIRAQLDELGLSLDNIADSTGQPIPPWLITAPKCDLSFSHLKKADTSGWKYRLLFNEHLSNTHSFPIDTDGSKSGNSVGSAMVCCGSVVARRIPCTASVFTAELYAISLALDHIAAEQYSNCTIYTDSLSSILALESLHVGSHSVLADIQNRLAHFSLTATSIQFFWIPGHVGIRGNELANNAAKSICSGTITPVPIPYMVNGLVFKAWLRASWQSTWSEQRDNKLFQIKPYIGLWSSSFCKVRKEEIVLSRLRIGHSFLTHCFLLSGTDAPMCSLCDTQITISHVLLSCHRYNSQRRQYFKHIFSQGLSVTLDSVIGDSDTVYLDNVFNFLMAINLFNLI